MSDKVLPNYVKLFGEIDFREADQARSVYSPAAYLTDLLQINDDRQSNASKFLPDSLDQRRPDIFQNITLDSENTFTLIPYLNIVNEVLEKKIKQHSGQEAYSTLLQATSPFNMPFNLAYERIALYSKYLEIRAEILHKAFAEKYDANIIAREYLGLANEIADELLSEHSSEALWQRYGNLQANLQKLKITEQSLGLKIPVKEYLAATGLSHLELKELLHGNLDDVEIKNNKQATFFCNNSLSGFATYDPTETYIRWLTTGDKSEEVIRNKWLDRAQRLIRLSHKIDLTISDLDLILRDCCDHKLNDESLKRIAIIKNLSAKLDLKIDETCALFSAMSDIGHGNENLPADLFNRVFNGSVAITDGTYIGTYIRAEAGNNRLKFEGDILALDNKTYRNRIAHGLQISENQLQEIVRGFRSRANEDIEDEENHNSLWSSMDEEGAMLSTLYRISKLASVLDTSYKDLFTLFDVLERDPHVRQIANVGVFIDNKDITQRNCYDILSQSPTQTKSLLWLVQLMCSLTTWLAENDLTAEDLQRTATDRNPRDLKLILDNKDSNKTSLEAVARREKIAALQNLYRQLRPSLLHEESFVSNTIDTRFARIIYDVITSKKDVLVAHADSRLVNINDSAIKAAAYESIGLVHIISKEDFLGLSLEDKIVEKIFANLVLKGYLTTKGVISESAMLASQDNFSMETNFTDHRESLFGIIKNLHENSIDVAIYPSDLESLGLTQSHLDELYDNLIFNGFLSEDGTLLQSATFDSTDNSEAFEVNSSVGEYASEVYQRIQEKLESFKTAKIIVRAAIFSKVPLDENELENLIDNLKFNEYIDQENYLTNHTALLSLNVDDLLLDLRFYPQRRAILAALQLHIESLKDKLYSLNKKELFEVANKLVADWAFEAIADEFLVEGRIPDKDRAFFKDQKNAANIDVAWPFESNNNRVVFDRVRAILQFADSYRLTNVPLEAFKFSNTEIDEIVSVLISTNFLTIDRTLPENKIQYFLNINNAIEFTLKSFEDYSKDVFFMLHTLALQYEKTIKEITEFHSALEKEQTRISYQALKDTFSLPAENLQAIVEQVFVGKDNVMNKWIAPVLATVNSSDVIESEPKNSQFNANYNRIRQFASLAERLKLDRDEIDIVFKDRQLIEKYPEHIELPEISKANGSKVKISSFDALLESSDGQIYLFKSADPATANDYARYWIYSSITHEIVKMEDDKLVILLSGEKDNTSQIYRVDAAYVDKRGNDVIIADGKSYIKRTSEIGSVWQAQEKEWGKVNTDFDDLQTINAAFTDASARTYLFSNDQYIRYTRLTNPTDDISTTHIDNGYPKNIVDSWHKEGFNQQLAQEFRSSIDAAFHGTNNKTYFFKGGQFVSSDDFSSPQVTKDSWWQINNNLASSQQVDACYADSGRNLLLSGKQIFAYRDSIENADVAIEEGYPKTLTEYFGKSLPGEFHAGVDSAFKGVDGKVHLFKDEKTVGISEGNNKKIEVTVATKDKWGVVENNLANGHIVDAALTGLDGRVYLFSGGQYFRYSSSDYSEVDTGYPRSVSQDWGGLTSINAAFVLDGKTYVFGRFADTQTEENTLSENMYVRYSTNDYTKPDDNYPKSQTETDDFWWNLPKSIKDTYAFTEVDAVFNAPDGKTYLFAKQAFIYFDQAQRWWSEPKKLSDVWNALPFTSIEAAFSGKDGKTYFFSGSEYVRFSSDDYCQLDNGYPRPTNKLWGNVKNNITEYGKVDAALLVESREQKENDDGSTETITTMHTYLFSGDQFFRYKAGDYQYVESGYPKTLDLLKDEPRFKNLNLELDQGIDAAFGDQRNIYLFMGSTIHVVSDTDSATYTGGDQTAFAGVDCVLMENGALYTEKNANWYHLSNPEVKNPVLTQEEPVVLMDVPDPFKHGLNAVLFGADSNTYLFKGNQFFNVALNRTFPIADQWGRFRNNIQDQNTIDAGFVGRDGKTYLFSGDQYVVYESNSYIGQHVFVDSAQTLAVNSIADQWGGLTNVHIAYVLGEQTFLFEKPDNKGNFRYVRYSSSDYQYQDAGFPQQADVSYWQMPGEYLASGWGNFAAIMVEQDEILTFIKGKEFLQLNSSNGHWFHPQPLNKLWTGNLHDDDFFDNLTSIFVDNSGAAYFFGEERYITHANGAFSASKMIEDDWGIYANPFNAKIDAAFVNGNNVTYLFAGDQYMRYTGADYCKMDEGYPKTLTIDLRQEEGFQNLPASFEVQASELNSGTNATVITAVVGNSNNIYVYMGERCYVSSQSKTRNYDVNILGKLQNRFDAIGKISAAFVSTDGKTYLFSGDQYVRYSDSRYRFVDDGYPKRIATGLLADFDLKLTIPRSFYADIDAAMLNSQATLYLFKGDKCLNTSTGVVSNIKDTWGKAKNNFESTTASDIIDGAFVDPKGRLHVFKGDQLIRYADTDQAYVETGFPKSIASTFKCPASFANGISGTFTFAGHTYLVKEDDYIRYSGNQFDCVSNFYPAKFIDRWGSWSDYQINDIQNITRFKQLQDSYSGDNTLVDFLKIDSSDVAEPYSMLSDIFNWDVDDVKWLKRNNAFLPAATKKEQQSNNSVNNNVIAQPIRDTETNLELIFRMFDIQSLSEKMGTSAKSVYEDVWLKIYSDARSLDDAAEKMLSLLATKNGNSPDWQVLVDEVSNKLNLLKRDALVPYVIHKSKDIFNGKKIEDTRDLYEQLLIDVQMGESAQISRIKEAISAVQLYFHRYLINLENDHTDGEVDESNKEILKERWKWMRNYRVWEANRKVFLYPENYIRPELRDTKSPEFKVLEEALLQGELTEANITQAFNQYIDRYIEVSRLTIAGGYVYDSGDNDQDKKIILFGRTKSEPHLYYYRTATFIKGKSDTAVWNPWIEVNVQIDADRVYPVFIFNKLYVFWAKIEIRSSNDKDTKLKFKNEGNNNLKSENDAVNSTALQVYYSYLNLNGEWATQQKMQYDITSNDMIIDFSLEISGVNESTNNKLDNILVNCHYTTERQIKPTTSNYGFVSHGEINKRFTEDALDSKTGKAKTPVNLEIYLKASNSRKNYYVDASQSPSKLATASNILEQGTSFKVVPLNQKSNDNFFDYVTRLLKTYSIGVVLLESVAKPKNYLQHRGNGSADLLVAPIDEKKVRNSCFIIARAKNGDGYEFMPVWAFNEYFSNTLYYAENNAHELILNRGIKRSLEKTIAQQQVAFSFISLKEQGASFRFYPETSIAKNVADSHSSISRSSIDTFNKLFPKENAAQVEQPIMMSVANNQHSIPWVCFDYKGGSFLCKPTSGQTESIANKLAEIENLPANFKPVRAAFYANEATHFFSKNGEYFVEGQRVSRPTADVWGLINNNIQANSSIDAALVTQEKTILFCKDQYVVYSHDPEIGSEYRYVDESYPRQLSTNTDHLPKWDHVDVSFRVGKTNYFIRGDEYVTTHDLATPRKLSDKFLPTDIPMPEVRNVFSQGETTYVFNNSGKLTKKYRRETIETKLDNLYVKAEKAADIPLDQVTAAFAIDFTVYMQVTNSQEEGNIVEYMRYEGGSTRDVLKDLNAAKKMKGVFVQGDYFYILRDPEDNTNPVIRRCAKNSASKSRCIEIQITGAPDLDADTFFYDKKSKKTYILCMREDQYMVINGLPEGESIKWKKAGNIAKFISSQSIVNSNFKIDAGFDKDGKVFLISGNEYIRFTPHTQSESEFSLSSPPAYDAGYPKLLGTDAEDGLPQWVGLDAAFQGIDGITQFFNGDHFTDSTTLTSNGEETSLKIKDKWGRVRNRIQETGQVDAALTIDRHVYLISADQYYRYSMSNLASPTLEQGYPKSLANNSKGFPSWIEPRIRNSEKIFALDEKIYSLQLGLFYSTYHEYDPRTSKNRWGFVNQKWRWPRNVAYDAAYINGDNLWLISGSKQIPVKLLNATEVNQRYDVIRLSSMTGSKLSQALFSGGIEGLMQRTNQEIDELPVFTFKNDIDKTYTEDSIIRVDPNRVNHENFPVESHLEFRGANGLYYWELFYHAPALIAQSLNAAQKFEQAKQWYEYIFDPTENDNFWKFLPFLAVDINGLIAVIEPWAKTNKVQEVEDEGGDDDVATIANPKTKLKQLNTASTMAATSLINKLKPFAPALLGKRSMTVAEKAEFNLLRGDWDSINGRYKTWLEVENFEAQLDSLANTDEKTQQKVVATQEVIAIIKRLPIRYNLMASNGPEQIRTYLDDPFDPHAIAALRRLAYRRTTVMAYIDNLLDWGDQLFRQYSHESINEARMLYILAYDLLGKKPAGLVPKEPSNAVAYDVIRDKGAENENNVYDFLFDVSADDTNIVKSLTHAGIVHESVANPYFHIPENEQILGYWERVEDRLYKIRHSLNIMGIKQALPLFQPPIDPMSIVSAVAGGGGVSSALASLQVAVPHYRFSFMLNKAKELTGKVSQFGNELLSTIEKKDAEELSILQNRQEGVILQMTRTIREAQLSEAQENLKNLEQTKIGAEQQKAHYEQLLSDGLITAELVQLSMMGVASAMFIAIPALKIGAAVASAFPNVKVGAPTTVGAETGGSLVASALGFAAEAVESIAEGISMGGETAGIMAQYERSREDWVLQEKMATSEIAQLEFQIEGNKWQIRAAEQELTVSEKEAEHNQSIATYMKGKFSNQQLYQWMSGKLSALYFQTYQMAHDMAKSAEMAFRFERGVPASQVSFIGGSYWDSLKKGLLAGDSLGLDLDRLEQAYLETHGRSFDITKTISLLALDPRAYLDLKNKGVCEFNFTEALFDYDFPGHYRRQIKSIAVKLNAGEGKTVNATLTQLRNKIVMEPDAKAVKYLMNPKDSQPLTIRNDWRPSQQIAVSEIDQYAENSSGVFELNFGDERYLPFEGTGAISSWRLQLGGKRGSYNINELADAEIEMKYTAHQGGDVFASAVKGMLKPYETAVYFDMALMFPNEFFAFVYGETDDMEINITRDMFPNLSGSKITGIFSQFEMKDNGQISLVMNDDSALTLRSNKLLLTDSLAVSTRGETWNFAAKGKKADLVNMGLVLAYKAVVE